MPTQPIIVLGAERSGTSMMGSIVHRWGAYGGEEDFLASGNEGNPQGYWEYDPVKPFLTELEKSTGLTYFHPNFKSILAKRAQESSWSERAHAFISKMEAQPRPWFWKEPSLSLLLPFWQRFWNDPTYVVMVRNPYESAMSLRKFLLPEGLREKHSMVAIGLLLWQVYALSILEGMRGVRRKIFIRYEDVLASPAEQAERLSSFLDAQVGGDGLDPDRIQRMAGAVDPDLWRNRVARPLASVVQASEAQVALYDLMQGLVESPDESYSLAEYPLIPGYWEYLEMLRIYG